MFSILGGFLLPFSVPDKYPQMSGLLISNSVLFFECCAFLSSLPFAAWLPPGMLFSRFILQDLFLQLFQQDGQLQA